MAEMHTKGEIHGCIVCGKLHELYAVYDSNGRFLESTVMSGDGNLVQDRQRPLVACARHSENEIKRAVERVYGRPTTEED